MEFYTNLFEELLGLESTNLHLKSDLTHTNSDWSRFSGLVSDENGETMTLYLKIEQGKAWLSNGWNRCSPIANLTYNIDQSTVVPRNKKTKADFGL